MELGSVFCLLPSCSQGFDICSLPLLWVLKSGFPSPGPFLPTPFLAPACDCWMWDCAKPWMPCGSVHTGCLLAALDSTTHWVPPGPENGRFVSYGLPKRSANLWGLTPSTCPLGFSFLPGWHSLKVGWADTQDLGLLVISNHILPS